MIVGQRLPDKQLINYIIFVVLEVEILRILGNREKTKEINIKFDLAFLKTAINIILLADFKNQNQADTGWKMENISVSTQENMADFESDIGLNL